MKETVEVLKKTAEHKKLTQVSSIQGWTDTYTLHNVKAGQRDVTGKYQLEYDKIAEENLALEQDKATLNFPTRTDKMRFMIDIGYYRKDLLRNGLTLDDVEDLYNEYIKHDIGYSRFYSRLVFIISFAYKITDESLFRTALNRVVNIGDRLAIEKELTQQGGTEVTGSVLTKLGISLTDAQIKAINNSLKLGKQKIDVTTLSDKIELSKLEELQAQINDYTLELVKMLGFTEEEVKIVDSYVTRQRQGLNVRDINKLYTDEMLDAIGLERKYLPKSRFDEKYILMEDRADRAVVHALDIVGGEGYTKEDVLNSIRHQALRNFQASTPSFSNAGLSKGGEKISCTILKIDDTLDSIRDRVGDTLMLSKMGAGIGIDGSDLRSLGESVGELDNRAHGAVKVAKMIESNVMFADQDGKRQGSAVYNIDVFNRDFLLVLDSKKENVDESMRLSMLSIGLVYRDKFFQLFLDGEEGFYTFAPHTIVKEYGTAFSEINMEEMYEELVANPRVSKEFVTFEYFIQTIGSAVSESGYPYTIYQGSLTREHAFFNEVIAQSNLCTEIAQGLTTDRAIQCNLASLDVLQVMANKSLGEVTKSIARHLNGVMDNSDFSKVPVVQRGMDERRAIGIGTANLQGFFATNGIPYESDEAVDFVRAFYSTLNYYSIYESMDLVRRGVYDKFVGFEDTTYSRGDYFDKYTGNNDYTPQTDKVKSLFEGMFIPTKEDWLQLKADVQKHGLANAYRIAIAPNGTTSYSMGGTAGITPNTQLVESRRTASMGSAMYPMPGLEDPSTYFLYKDAYRVSDFKYFDLVREIQDHVDQGISATIFITDDYTTSDWWSRIVYGWVIGLKTLYYTRPKINGAKQDSEVENHEACESCSG